MGEVMALAEFAEPISKSWYRATPSAIASATGGVHIALLAALTRNYDMGGKDWVSQFIFGFPLVGSLSQSGVWEVQKIASRHIKYRFVIPRSRTTFPGESRPPGYNSGPYNLDGCHRPT